MLKHAQCAQGLATADHTTLLLNCYTKAKDVDKLDAFLKGAERQSTSGTFPFSIDTAVKVRTHTQPACNPPE